MIAVKLLLAKYWKSERVPLKKEWLIKCYNIFLMEKLTAIRSLWAGKLTATMVYKKRWGKFIRYWDSIEQQAISQQTLPLLYEFRKCFNFFLDLNFVCILMLCFCSYFFFIISVWSLLPYFLFCFFAIIFFKELHLEIARYANSCLLNIQCKNTISVLNVLRVFLLICWNCAIRYPNMYFKL